MKLYEALNINLGEKKIISFVGGGGKTTSLFRLARELKKTGGKVLITTTTSIYSPTKESYDQLILTDEDEDSSLYNIKEKACIFVIGKAISRENKLLGLESCKVMELSDKNIFDYILVEADGSKSKSIKAPAPHEPVVPSNTTKLIGVIGLDAINKPIGNEWIHRPQLFSQLTEGKIEDKIDIKKVVKLVMAEEGLYKNCPPDCQKYLLLNKTDDSYREQLAMEIFNCLKKKEVFLNGVVAASMKKKENYIKWSDSY